MKKRFKKPELTCQQQNQIQNIGSKYGVILTYGQMVQYCKYRSDAIFSNIPEASVLYLVLTPTQRARFDQVRDQYGF